MTKEIRVLTFIVLAAGVFQPSAYALSERTQQLIKKLDSQPKIISPTPAPAPKMDLPSFKTPDLRYAKKVPSLTISKLTGTVQIKRGNEILMVLKAGDKLPEQLDANVSFAVVDGSFELNSDGKIIAATAGSNFFVGTAAGDRTTVQTEEGSPVEVRMATGQSIILTENTTIQITKTQTDSVIEVKDGRALVSNPALGETKILNAGDTAKIASPATQPDTAAAKKEEKKDEKSTKKDEKAKDNDKDTTPVIVIETPQTSVIPSHEVKESSKSLSPSTP